MSNQSATKFNFIGDSSEFCGNLTINGDTHIFGKVEGNITGTKNTTLTIEYTGQVRGDISNINVVLHGQLLGNILDASRVEVSSTARIKGNITAKKLQIFPGAKINGQLLSLKEDATTL